MTNIVVFASGSGTNFQSIIDAANTGLFDATIRGLITNRPNIQSIDRAQKHNIAHLTVSPSDFSENAEYEQTLLQQLKNWDTDLIALAGYLLKIPSCIIEAYRGRIINIHPSLLPKYGGKGFYGMRVHRAVIENGDSKSGCTVHLVNKEYDQGKVLGQRQISVKESDDAESLASRVLEEEHKLFPKVIADLTKQLNAKSNR